VFRRSAVGRGGDSGFLLDVFRVNHENGLVSLRDGAGGGGREVCFSSLAGGGGGGGKLTGDILPDRPWSPESDWRGGSFGRSPGDFVPSGRSQFYNLDAADTRILTHSPPSNMARSPYRRHVTSQTSNAFLRV
jgi:hypothetical protein